MSFDVKKILDWKVVMSVMLIVLSALVYFIHYLIFRDARHIFIYLIGDIAFVFIEVLLVTIVIHEMLAVREKKNLLNKLNMVIGAFYSEVGTKLIRLFSVFDSCSADIGKELVVRKEWTDKQFDDLRKNISFYTCPIDCGRGDLGPVRDFLVNKRDFLLRLLENPSLLEHEKFTNLLWTVFHLTEELENRTTLKDLPGADYEHIAGDIKRAYALLISEWLAYMKHLRSNYPYLFSLAVRTNPFDPKAEVTVK